MINFQNTYSLLPKHFYAEGSADTLDKPGLIAINHSFAEDELGLTLANYSDSELEQFFSGQNLPEEIKPIALAYAGHQFGHFNPQLGDGRALLLGEVLTPKGKRFDIQLKGSGATYFSRGGDGKSPIGPVIREYIVSEAMHHLGIPTTRALAAVASGEDVGREELLPGGIFTRVASSHIRIGTFEFFFCRQDLDGLKKLADYTIDRHYSEVKSNLKSEENIYLKLLESVAKKQSTLVASWMSVGFIHGVMNTDNMTISGETIDFGPCAFIDDFLFNKVFSSIDRNGRYSYSNQLEIAKWNLYKFAETLIPLIDNDQKKAIEILKVELEKYSAFYDENWLLKMRPKFGLFGAMEGDKELINTWLQYLEDEVLDFTISFRDLTDTMNDTKNDLDKKTASNSFYFLWQERLKGQSETIDDSQKLMNQVNPIFIPRNHQVERAIQLANKKDYSIFEELNELLQNPYCEQPKFEKYKLAPTPEEIVEATFCGT
jgi:uncharacterized protein YdiU (UPF0061 family)